MATEEQAIVDLMKQLNLAIHAWYKKNNPKNKSKYASCHFQTYHDGRDVPHRTASITLQTDKNGGQYTDICVYGY